MATGTCEFGPVISCGTTLFFVFIQKFVGGASAWAGTCIRMNTINKIFRNMIWSEASKGQNSQDAGVTRASSNSRAAGGNKHKI